MFHSLFNSVLDTTHDLHVVHESLDIDLETMAWLDSYEVFKIK